MQKISVFTEFLSMVRGDYQHSFFSSQNPLFLKLAREPEGQVGALGVLFPHGHGKRQAMGMSGRRVLAIVKAAQLSAKRGASVELSEIG